MRAADESHLFTQDPTLDGAEDAVEAQSDTESTVTDGTQEQVVVNIAVVGSV